MTSVAQVTKNKYPKILPNKYFEFIVLEIIVSTIKFKIQFNAVTIDVLIIEIY